MIYLDNAATTMPKPPAVYEAVDYAMRTCASIGRSGHRAAMEAAQVAFDCRQTAGALFDTPPEQVVFTLNATHGLNIAIQSLVQPGDQVVISGFEHNAVLRPLHHIGAEIVVAGRRLFEPDSVLEEFDAAITKDTKAVVCNHCSNVFGFILPVEEIAALCRRRSVPFVLDASQSAGCLPVSLSRLGAAFIAMPGHKGLYGPQGTGLLLCGQTPKPLLQGGTGSQSASAEMPDFLPDAAEAGTHNVPGIAGLLEGLRYVREKGCCEILSHERRLMAVLRERLNRLPNVETFFGGMQTGVLSLRVKNQDCEETAARLAQEGFAVRAGLQCAPLAHESAGTMETGTVRISVSDFNREEQMTAVSDALARIAGSAAE